MERRRLLAGDERGGPENPKISPFPRARSALAATTPTEQAGRPLAALPLLLAKTAEAMGGFLGNELIYYAPFFTTTTYIFYIN